MISKAQQGMSLESKVCASPVFALRAHQHLLIASMLKDHATILEELVDGLGSPLHIVLPQIFVENVKKTQDVFKNFNLSGSIYFAKKANKADCFARACADDCRAGIDVSSSEELYKALAAGITGERIGVSGPEKSDRLLIESLRHRCRIVIDSLQELERLFILASNLNVRVCFLLRHLPKTQPNSRFGLDREEMDKALGFCLRHISILQLEGFAFHLSGYSIEERACCANEMVNLCLHAQENGLNHCYYVNIGGGLPVQYFAPELWEEFQKQTLPAGYHADKVFGGFYPYGVARAGSHALQDLLNFSLDCGQSLANKIRRHQIKLVLEPGRALLDQAGITIFDVLGVKERTHNSDSYAIITVKGSSFSLSEQWFNSEYLPDPVLLDWCESDSHFLACVGGSTCLESDMITWRKVPFRRPVRPGDRLVYLNTAGYQMDSNESCFHDAKLPKKVVMEFFDNEKGPRWRLDSV